MNTSGIGILSKFISTQVTLILTIYIRHSAKWGGNIGYILAHYKELRISMGLRHEICQNSH